LKTITIDTWLYGELACYGGDSNNHIFSNPSIALPEGGRMCDLLNVLGLETDQRGITFINGDLSAMPGLQPDLEHIFRDGDRVAFFHLRSMWPFQYRHGVSMVNEMHNALQKSDNMGIHHAYAIQDDQ